MGVVLAAALARLERRAWSRPAANARKVRLPPRRSMPSGPGIGDPTVALSIATHERYADTLKKKRNSSDNCITIEQQLRGGAPQACRQRTLITPYPSGGAYECP